jgi:hypothetical protein
MMSTEHHNSELPLNSSRRPCPSSRLSRILPFSIVGIAVGLPIVVFAALVYVRAEQRDLERKRQIQQLGLMYHAFASERGKSPTSLDELQDYKPKGLFALSSSDDRDAKIAIEMVKDGRFIVVWGAVFAKDGNKSDSYVLGYEAHVPTDGGIVLLGGGVVAHRSATAFKAMPKIPTISDPTK